MVEHVDGLDVLVVEDSDQMRHYLRSVLEIVGATRIRDARDGAEATRLLASEAPDLVITDYQMEPVDGAALTRRIREARSDTCRFLPVIMITACSEPAQLTDVRQCGVNLVLQKPVSPQAVTDAVEEVLREPVPFIRTRSYFGPERRRAGRTAVPGERRVPAAASAD